jgi:hypothetical protein
MYPPRLEGRGFFLDFQNFNLTASVFVNGQLLRVLQSAQHQPGSATSTSGRSNRPEVNELVVVFKDAYYGLSTKYSEDRSQGKWVHGEFWNLPSEI